MDGLHGFLPLCCLFLPLLEISRCYSRAGGHDYRGERALRVLAAWGLGALIGGGWSAVYGDQPKEEVLEPLVVTATRTEIPLREVGSAMTVLTAEDLARRQRMPVLEVLRGLPGVDVVQSGGLGQQTSVLLRGANANHTLVLIDGVEANDPSNPAGLFDFAHLLTDNIERIEILRGSQSTLYGSDAIGGVINIITKQGAGRAQVTTRAEGGSFGTFKVTGGVHGGEERVDYSLTASRLESEGISAADARFGNPERDGYRNTTVVGRLGLRPWANLALDATLRYHDARTEIDGSTVDAEGRFLPIDDPNAVLYTEQLFLRGQGRLSLLEGLWDQILGISLTRHDREIDDRPDPANPFPMPGIFIGEKVKLDWQNNLHLPQNHTVTFGIETEEESMEAQAPDSVLPRQRVRITGYYAQDQLSWQETLFLTGGVRLDDHSLFGSQVTGRATAALVFDTLGLKLRSSYGTGFRAPSLSQLFDDRFNTIVGDARFEFNNPDLGPEKSESWDVGVEQSFWNNQLEIGATYFDSQFTDLIDFGQVTPERFQLANIAEAEAKGWEFFMAVTPTDNLTLRGDYTQTQTQDKQTGEALLRRPEHKAGINANYRFFDKGNIHLQIIHIGRRRDLGEIRMPSYTVVNLAASYDLTARFQLFARVNNLLDKQYQEVFGFGTPGVSGFGGAELVF
jgi:vitamin B12 transporter